jgi:hypothetical protein
MAIKAPVFSHKTWWDGSMVGGFEAVEPTITSAGKNVYYVGRNYPKCWEPVVYCYEQIAAEGYALEAILKHLFWLETKEV